ncbi:MAG: HAMP domain-containing histidine kinase [Lachnospiraceae bacterium]|nr:HAMP domain-containing histidine kinase [Lachnospiraceae bacterium]
MKAFFRTGWGKLILILICIASLLTTAACAVGTCLAVANDDGYVYLRTQDEALEEFVEPRLQSQAWHALNTMLNGPSGAALDERNLAFYASNTDTGEVIYLRPWTLPQTQKIYRKNTYRFYCSSASGGVRIAFSLEELPREIRVNAAAYDVYVTMEYDSSYALMSRFIVRACRLGWWNAVIALAALALAVISFIALMRVSARRPEREDPVPGLLHKVPYELMLAVSAAVLLGIVYFIDWIVPIDYTAELLMVIGAVAVGLLILIGLSMSAAGRVKTRTLLRNTLTFRILKYLVAKPLAWLWKGLKKLHAFNMSILRGLPLVGKTALFLGVLAIVELNVTAAADGGPLILLSLIKYLILIPLVLYFALCLRRLQKGGEALAAGDLAYQTDTKGLPFDLKKHAEDLNSIGGGMAIAVQEQLKSERMKTELITNVSHDLKTPLTSLINYADLISKESCDNPKITEYSEVLLRQSERLKRLIEDLVEASRASSGDLDIDLVPCDAAVFLEQAAGEYEEKLHKAGLTLITKQPEQEIRIMADGRRMWRIFDNLMNNIVKYSLAGTRVYLSLEQEGGDAVITFRNTSREPLDAVNTEELTERFTRGDASRNTEGSGLGLAIAKSLTELQGGKFLVSADGDLFKAVLRFPKI